MREFCTYKQDDAVWNYFRTHLQDNLVPYFVLSDVFVKIYRYIYAEFPKEGKETRSSESVGSKILGLSSILIEQGLKQRKSFSFVHFFNPV